MNTISRHEFVEALNEYAFSENPKEVISILNILIDEDDYQDCLDLVFMAISSTQLYGFLSYFSDEIQERFFDCDYFRTNSYRGKNIDFYNRGQLSFLLELEKNKKVFFSAPTSFGKTGIIIEYILNNFNQLNNIVFVVPTNSLIEELFCKFLKYNNQLQMGYNVSTQPILLYGKNILFLTPERFMLIAEEKKLSQFDLIVMDETYKIVDSRNELISDFVNNRAVRFRKVADMIGASTNKVVFLSPFTYSLTDSMERFLKKHDIKKIDRRLEYVNREIISLKNAETIKEYFDKNVKGYSSTIINKSKVLLDEIRCEKNIAYVANYSKAYDIVDKIDFSCLEDSSNDRFQSFLSHIKTNYAIDGQTVWKVIEALEKGIGIYISPLPRYIKKEIVNLYEAHVINTLIVTTAFTEGVNTSASNLIFTSLVNGPNTNKLSDIDILNVSGRVGRFASKTVGRVFCISDEIYERISKLQNVQDVRLENYNYSLMSNRIDYEIDMIDSEFLSKDDKEKKEKIDLELSKLGLQTNDLKISLNVSNQWKISLFKFFSHLNKSEITEINRNIESIYLSEEGRRIESLNCIFKSLKAAFDMFEIDGFPQEKYEVHPFDSSGEFTWGRLYQVYLSGSIKQVIAKNINFIQSKYKEVVGDKIYSKKASVDNIFESRNLKWVLSYYDSNLQLNYNAFYSETFKFISNIVQYKIPFYLSFYVSVFKLFVSKNHIEIHSEKGFDIKKLVNIFEEGDFEGDYKQLIDYGLPISLLNKLSTNKVSFENIKSQYYDKKILDNYENIMVNDIAKLL
jgi:Superfamily II helicase